MQPNFILNKKMEKYSEQVLVENQIKCKIQGLLLDVINVMSNILHFQNKPETTSG